LTPIRDAELLEFYLWVMSGQVELVADQSGSMTTALPAEATLENEGGEPRGVAGLHLDGIRRVDSKIFVFLKRVL
jgi:hypothetical protein